MGMTSYDKGIAVGMLKEHRRILLLLLKHRFGEISQVVRDRIETYSHVQLDTLIDGVYDGHSLEELGLEDCTPTIIVTQGDS